MKDNDCLTDIKRKHYQKKPNTSLTLPPVTHANAQNKLINSFMTEVPTICRANQCTGFYMRGTSTLKELSLRLKI